MASIKLLSKSFGSGEVSPEMWGRIDDAKWDGGTAVCRNFITTPQGPVLNRPGLAYVATTKNGATTAIRLIPFTYSTTNTMVIELGNGYFRFYRNGAPVTFATPAAYSGSTAYTAGQLVSYSGSNYVCILATTGNLPTNTTYWYAQPNTNVYEVKNSYLSSVLFDIHYVQSNDVITLCHPNYPPATLSRYGDTQWAFASIPFAAQIPAPTGLFCIYSLNGGSDTSGLVNTYSYVITALDSDQITESVQSATTQVTGNLLATGASVLTIWQPNSVQPFAYNVYKMIGGVYGYIGQVPGRVAVLAGVTITATSGLFNCTATTLAVGDAVVIYGSFSGSPSITGHTATTIYYIASTNGSTTFYLSKTVGGTAVSTSGSGTPTGVTFTGQPYLIDANIAPDLSKTPPYYDSNAAFSASGDYPAAVSYFQQRKVFAGTTNRPQNVWMTRSGTEAVMSYSLPVRDADRVAFRVAARESQTIRHIVPLTQLILLTNSSEWKVTGTGTDTVTPSSISVSPQSYVGASNVQPCVIQNSLVFCANRGGHVREMMYNWQAGGFVSSDISLRAAHLFDGLTIQDMAYSKAPRPILWFVSSNGTLLGLTYLPEQQISAWHRHDTQGGTFESCCVVSEAQEDVLYVSVKRSINGSTVRYIERMATRLITDPTQAFFVDAGVSYNFYSSGARAFITGLTHLYGQTISILADGAVHTPKTVTQSSNSYTGNGSTTTFAFTFNEYSSSNLVVTVNGLVYPLATTYSVSLNYPSAGGSITFATAPANGATILIASYGVTLDVAATYVQAGLPITADLQTLPVAAQIDGAFGYGRQKNVNKVWVRVKDASGMSIGPDASHQTAAKQRTSEAYGSPPALITGEIPVTISPTWGANGQVWIRQTQPLPLEVVALTVEVALGA